MKPAAHFRSALVLAALIVACSSRDDDDKGCGKIGERACSIDKDCDGFLGPDFAIFGPEKSTLCLTALCEAQTCKTIPRGGKLEDDQRGDCQRPSCDAEGRLTHALDSTDTGSAEDAQCQRRTCEPVGTLFGESLASLVTRNVIDGTACRLADDGDGVCRFGRCVAPHKTNPVDAGSDSGKDGGKDGGESDDDAGPLDASSD